MDMAHWSNAARSVWGKSRATDDAWMPLVQHLQDSAAVAEHLWDRWVSPGVRRQASLGLPEGEDDGRLLVRFLAGVHDVGKATPAFAVQVPALLDRMRVQGLDCPQRMADSRLVRHDLAGQVIVRRWLQERVGATPGGADALACVVGGHHGLPASSAGIERAMERPDLMGSNAWTTVQHELLDGMASSTGAIARLSTWVRHPPEPVSQAMLTALVIVADWLASDDTRFPFGNHAFEQNSTVRAEAAWQHWGLPPMWRVGAPPRAAQDHLRDRFSIATPRPVQVDALEAAWEMDSPGVLVVEAPMGVGKTELGLGAAEILAHRFGFGGVFVALPTMATSDAMFHRVHAWLTACLRDGDQDTTIHLAHGRAHLNEEFERVARVDGVSAIYDDEPGRESPEAVVMSWFAGRKKGPLANVVVGTIDQVLFGALQAKHLVLRQLAIASKVVVVDEVHASDDYMRQYLARVLEWLGALGTPVVLLSATLPPAQRRELLDAHADGRGRPRPALPVQTHYPLVTTMTDAGCTQHGAEIGAAREVQLATVRDEDRVSTLVSALAEGGCAAVICNTVARAQEVAGEVEEAFPGEVMLLHSRFTALDRQEREQQLLARLGPGEVDRPRRLVVVGTQVLEQSLDIDVDLMISDLAPVDLVLQRMGRLHRHARDARPAAVRTPRFLISGADWGVEPPEPVRGSVAVYQRARLLRSAAALHEHLAAGVMRLPQDIPSSVVAGYDLVTAPGPPGWAEAIAVADRDDARRRSDRIGRARVFLVPPVPYPGESLTDSMPTRVGGTPEEGRAQVRDSEDGIEVVVVRTLEGEVRTMPGSHARADTVIEIDGPPRYEVARYVASCTLRLPLSLTNPRVVDQVIAELERSSFAGWQGSPWLGDALVLVLDDRFRAHLAGRELAYSQQTGLTVTVTEES